MVTPLPSPNTSTVLQPILPIPHPARFLVRECQQTPLHTPSPCRCPCACPCGMGVLPPWEEGGLGGKWETCGFGPGVEAGPSPKRVPSGSSHGHGDLGLHCRYRLSEAGGGWPERVERCLPLGLGDSPCGRGGRAFPGPSLACELLSPPVGQGARYAPTPMPSHPSRATWASWLLVWVRGARRPAPERRSFPGPGLHLREATREARPSQSLRRSFFLT